MPEKEFEGLEWLKTGGIKPLISKKLKEKLLKISLKTSSSRKFLN